MLGAYARVSILDYSLNRAVAVMRVQGPAEALSTINAIADKRRLEGYYLYHSLLGEIYSRLGRNAQAKKEFGIALGQTKSIIERRLLESKRDNHLP